MDHVVKLFHSLHAWLEKVQQALCLNWEKLEASSIDTFICL